jgi:hypothetical protein
MVSEPARAELDSESPFVVLRRESAEDTSFGASRDREEAIGICCSLAVAAYQ